jgi:hypothetical protein
MMTSNPRVIALLAGIALSPFLLAFAHMLVVAQR